jgi:CubicO group peptidase (beta-lactamase class C family)
MKQPFIFLLLTFSLSSCLKEDEIKIPFISYTPQTLNDGWEISDPSQENIDPSGLSEIYRNFHENEEIWQVRSLLVFRNGKLIAESYTKDKSDINTPRAIWSCTKQVMGLLTGIAIENQIIKSVDDPISDYLNETEVYQDKKDIRIKDLLTMRSGISYSNDGLAGQSDDVLRQLHSKITSFILSRPVAYKPGENAQYKDCDPQLVAAVIQAKCGVSTDTWAKKVLFEKLDIKNLNWDKYKDGTTLGGFGILTTPREMAKFGQCVLDSGQWKGAQVVNKEWIRQMTTIRIPDMYGHQFCYLWWKDTARGMTFMWGHGGQYVCIIPSKKLVVVMTAEVNTQDDFQFNKNVFSWVDRIVKIAN